MILNIFFINKKERLDFIKNQFQIEIITQKRGSLVFEEINGIKSIKLKNSFKGIPGFWMEIDFYANEEGKKLYGHLLSVVKPQHINNHVFYPRSNKALKDLETQWIHKYDLLNRENHDEVWKLFFQEIKSHMKEDRIDLAYKGLMIFLKHNPFFLKKYKRFYILEDLAYLYENEGNVGKAIKCLKMQAVLEPYSVEPYLNMSSFYIINGIEEEAFNVCREALKKNPENQYLISNLVISLINIGSYEYATDLLEKALDKHPDNPYFWKLMGDILYEIEDNRGAIDCYHRALKLGKEPLIEDFKLDVYTGIGDCYYEEENFKEAVNYYRKALNHNPKDTYLLMSLSQIYFFRLKETKNAYKYTKLLVENMPENGYGQFQLGLIHSRLGNIEKAIWHLYKARRMIPYYKPVHDAINIIKKTNNHLQAY